VVTETAEVEKLSQSGMGCSAGDRSCGRSVALLEIGAAE
jgi:hypothetical protein